MLVPRDVSNVGGQLRVKCLIYIVCHRLLELGWSTFEVVTGDLGKSISLSGVSGRCERHESPELDNTMYLSSGNMSARECLVVLTST